MVYKTFNVLIILVAIVIAPILCAPASEDDVLVVSSTAPAKESTKEGKPAETTPKAPQIYQMHIRSNISNRFAHTTVTSRVRNFANKSQEAVFSVVLPESAYISGFIMELDGKNYTAYVKEKEEAKRVYDEAVASGLGAAHVAVSARDSNRFTVSVNIEPEAKAAFYLTYEQLLNRQDGHYEQIINIHPGQPVKDLSAEVVISETRKIIDLKVPPLRSGNEIGTDKAELDPRAEIESVSDTSAVVKFTPNVERQKELAHVFGTNVDDGLAGQFVVQYDVERDPHGGEVLVQDGYFVHFFAPTDLKPLPKQVVFVLDTSGSMWGQKLEQVKEAMNKILDQLNEQDSLNLIEFNSNTRVWNLDAPTESIWYPQSNSYYYSDVPEDVVTLKNASFPPAYPANANNIKNAKEAVSQLKSDGSTSMYGALEVGLHLVELERTQSSNVKRQPMIVFLTDGEPTDLSTEDISTKISEFNSEARKAPIFALSFGDGADKEFLQKLSLRNSGFSRHIYEAADASLQLQDFYRQISSPLLSDVTFKYEPTVTSLTKTDFPIHFGGSEIVVAGWCGTEPPTPTVDGTGINGQISLKPVVTKSISNMERLWAYLSINQLLEKKETSETDKDELKKKALDLALKYSFVTSVSSLVVVKPNASRTVDAEEAKAVDTPDAIIGLRSGGYGGGFGTVPKLAHPMLALSAAPAYDVDSAYIDQDFLPESFEKSVEYFTTVHPESELDRLLEQLPWLNDILTDGVVKVPTGTYKLGLNETISDNVTCAKTPMDKEGYCTLLHECPEVYAMLTESKNFFDHFCILKDEYAGVCCPNKS